MPWHPEGFHAPVVGEWAVVEEWLPNEIYWRAERHNGDLDRDNDRIACEQA